MGGVHVLLLNLSGCIAWISHPAAGLRIQDIVGTRLWDWFRGDRPLVRDAFARVVAFHADERFIAAAEIRRELRKYRFVLHPVDVEPFSVVCLATAIPRQIELLSARERQVAALLGRSQNRKQIGCELGIRPATVDAHCAAIQKKLDCADHIALQGFCVLHSSSLTALTGENRAAG